MLLKQRIEKREKEKIEKALRKFFERQNHKISKPCFESVARLLISVWELNPYNSDESNQKALIRRLRRKWKEGK